MEFVTGDISLRTNYQIPTLHLKNVEVRNFLYDYQSLIYVENDNFIVRKNPLGLPELTARHFGNYKAGANIVIEDSNIVDSSFALGMIYVPPAQRFIDPKDDVLYAHQHN